MLKWYYYKTLDIMIVGYKDVNKREYALKIGKILRILPEHSVNKLLRNGNLVEVPKELAQLFSEE